LTHIPGRLEISKERITNEKAPVHLVDSDHILLRKPFKIRTEDFDQWVLERSLYNPRHWDEEWKPLISTFDPEERPSQGTLLVKRIGKGRVIYTSLTFFRQVPEAIPGAIKLFSNLIVAPIN